MIRELDTVYGKMFLPDTDNSQFAWLSVSGTSIEGPYIDKVCSLLKERGCDIAIDIGANFGTWTLALAKVAKNVMAFEPQWRVADLLAKSAEANGINGSLVLFRGALGNRIGETHIPDMDFEHEENFGGLEVEDERFDVPNISIPISTLDAVVESSRIVGRKVSFIKIDIEGGELAALEGAVNTIRRHKPVMFVEAFHYKSDAQKINDFILELGYVITALGPNFLCIPTSAPPPPSAKEHLRTLVEAARVEWEAGNAVQAEVLYGIVLQDTDPPDIPMKRVARGEACVFFGRKNLAQKRTGHAIDYYLMAVNADPLAPDYRLELIVKMLVPSGMLEEAHSEAIKLTRIEPNDTRSWRALGIVEQRRGKVEACVEAYDKALELAPDSLIAKMDRSTVACDMADYATLYRLLEPHVDDKDFAGDVLHNIAMARYRQGYHEEAIEFYEKAIAAKPSELHMTYFNMSLALHSIGRYREGWAAHEHRGQQTIDRGVSIPMNRFVRPRWNHEPAPARLHLHREMGDGDAIAMARFVPILVKQGYDVRLEINDAMVELMKRSFPQVSVHRRALDYPGAIGIPDFDYHVPMLSFPYLFDLGMDNIPAEMPYIKADKEKGAYYRQIDTARGGKRIGICWSSGIRLYDFWLSEYGRRKSMHLDKLSAFLRHASKKHDLFSLQVGPEREQAKDYCGVLFDVLPKKPDWDDTAALIDTLDLVITVDTSVAHLAGAMGKPTWIMSQRDGCSWHWMCYRPGASWNEKSSWYPTVRVFRQHEFNQPNYWEDVISDITKELGRWN